MNKKGFTLVELVATVVVLSCVALLTSTAITRSIKKSKQDLYNTQLGLIRDGAINYVSENINLVPKLDKNNKNASYYINLNEITDAGILDKDINNPITNENFTNGDLCIKVILEYNETYNKTLFKYEITDKDSDCLGIPHFGE